MQGIALYDPDLHASLASLYGNHDPGVCARGIGALALELLGESERATEQSQDAIALARKLGHLFSHTQALVFAAFIHRERGDWQRSGRLAEEAAGIAREQGFVQLLARATTIQGWSMAQTGDVDSGVAQMGEGIASIQKLGSAFVTYLLGALTDVQARAGRDDVALEVVTNALAGVGKTGERFYESELLRLRGELLLTVRRDSQEAERCFRTALDIASRQHARLLELRASDSLRRLLDREGRAGEARALVVAEESRREQGRLAARPDAHGAGGRCRLDRLLKNGSLPESLKSLLFQLRGSW